MLRYLRRVRIVVATLFALLTTLIFLDFGNLLSPAFVRGTLYLQFIPSLINLLHGAVLGTSGCLVVLGLTMLCGRVYCSTICPLGALQDVIGRMGGRSRFRFTSAHNSIRYGMLTLVVLGMAAGISLLVNLLDPFSVFGRMMATLTRPLAVFVNNIAATFLEMFGVYALTRQQWSGLTPVAFGTAVTMLGLVGFMAARHGRLYCNTLCPVGALLGIASKKALLRIGMDQTACIRCGKCAAVCKAGCINLPNMEVDTSRCVACCNCLAVCSENALGLTRHWRSASATTNRGRRAFLLHTGLSLLGVSGISEPNATIIQSKPTTIPEPKCPPLSPPGSISTKRFTSICTACNLCVSVCPARVLSPALLEYGPAGILQPHLDFHTGHCNYECTLCSEVCPTGALQLLSVETKKLTQLGVARFIKENCVVFTDNTSCGACSEHCPTKAVHMMPYPNPLGRQLVIPEVNPDICVGCGGCEHACPTKPFKAIYVEGNPVHKLAQKPSTQKMEMNNDNSDFPF